MKTQTKESQEKLNPLKAVELLKDGNKRFVNNLKINRNLLQQMNETSDAQFPFAAILSCIDSRTSAELIFDQGLGDIFSVRIAGNILNNDILGSLEFACKLAGSKLIMVLGHSNCGAIKGACSNVELGHLTGLLNKIKPAVEAVKIYASSLKIDSQEFTDKVAEKNVKLTMKQILEKSSIITELMKNGKIAIIGGLYNVETGVVEFFDQDMITEHKFETFGKDYLSL